MPQPQALYQIRIEIVRMYYLRLTTHLNQTTSLRTFFKFNAVYFNGIQNVTYIHSNESPYGILSEISNFKKKNRDAGTLITLMADN